MDDLLSASRIISMMSVFEGQLMKAGRVLAASACKGSGSSTHLTRSLTFGDTYHPDLKPVPQLYVLGNTTIFAKGVCVLLIDCCSRTYYMGCSIKYHLKDSFRDVPDVLNCFGPDVDLPGSSPYAIYADWGNSLTHYGMF